ncbi:cellobiose dehydrogenase [Cordyceps militaris CM01]|uniref:Cellobiose dehydrogenase n=1 Tax=Cordyceps militaris (strain CM01) TaxID=983644 RepID=G3J2U1_CORMM|nr:cellobiose dehydrogenase [Cordyceps militaris CM01]EGX96425.1 cellobiose dehydrogenase [Cordyceps militaris CM01]
MRLSSFWRYAAAAVAVLVPSLAAADDADNPTGQSTFVSPDKDLGFAFTIGDEDVNDYFVTMRMRTTRSWGAIGLGSHDMAGALYFVMYLNAKGDNVTLSPRLAYGHYEPRFYDAMRWEYLPGTGVKDGFATLSFRCIECQNWPGADSGKGYLDLNSNSQKSIWALGPRQKLHADDQRAPLRYHESHGVFSIDMARTKGTADAPVLTDKSVDEGITQVEHVTKLFDVKSSMHAALMTLAILVLFPLGIVLLRVGRWASWHGVNQAVALVIVLAGFGMGIATSFHYNRSMSFNSAHQIIGLLVVAFLLGQFTLGVLHHLEYRRTRAPTRYGRIHVWLGNGVLLLAIGYFFAMNFVAALGLCITVMVLCLTALFLSIRQIRAAKKRRIAAAFGAAQAASYGDDRWTDNEPGTARDRDDHDPLPNPSVKRAPGSPSPWKSGSGRVSHEEQGHELGTRTNKPFL